jgi:rapamycin-insensitive companion of mTOR
MFAPGRLQTTLCAGYFPMIGVLSSDPKGLDLLQRWRMFNMMYHILSHKQRPDLIKLLLNNFDYTIPGHPRVLIEQALTSGTRDIRITATNSLRKYATRPFNENDRNFDKVAWKWAIRKLVDQLYDPDVEVCRTAVKILEKACNRKAYLEYVVQCRPTMDHLGEMSAPLLLRFLSSSSGYHYLDGLDYISNEMDDWFLGKNDSYVDLIETSLAKAFSDNVEAQTGRLSIVDEAHAEMEHETHIPPHFYRELARTKEGCKLLSDKGHFAEFANTIRDYGMQSTDPELMLRVKASMWAVGNVGSMEPGAPFLESCNVVENIVQIAQEHEVMSLRGTAFFVLGLISRSVHGLEILSECGWDSNLNATGSSIGFCIPNNLSKFFSYKPWKHNIAAMIRLPDSQKTILSPPPASAARPPLDREELPPAHDNAAVNERILELIVDLGNMILFKRAMTELKEIKQRKAPGFTDPKLFKRVMAMFEYNHYRLPIRRMVIELFEKSVLRQIVFEEDTDDDEADQTARPRENYIEEEDEEEDEDGGGHVSSSGDEVRTARQRSVSDAQELMPQGLTVNGAVLRYDGDRGGYGSSFSQRIRGLSASPRPGQGAQPNGGATDTDSSSEDDDDDEDDDEVAELQRNRGISNSSALNVSFAARSRGARSNSGASNDSMNSLEVPRRG